MIQRCKTAARYLTGLLVYRLRLRGLAKSLPLSVQNWCDAGLFSYGERHSDIANEVAKIIVEHSPAAPPYGERLDDR